MSPQGYLASMDGYTHRFSLITQEIEKVTIVDDTLLYNDNVEKNFHDVCRLLEICHKAGLVFKSDKFQFGQPVVEFAGLDVTMDGLRPCIKLLESIRSFPRPNSLSEDRNFFGMVNQVAYSFSMSSVMDPFRHLLKPYSWSTSFVWTDELVEKFDLAKEEIVKAVTDVYATWMSRDKLVLPRIGASKELDFSYYRNGVNVQKYIPGAAMMGGSWY